MNVEFIEKIKTKFALKPEQPTGYIAKWAIISVLPGFMATILLEMVGYKMPRQIFIDWHVQSAQLNAALNIFDIIVLAPLIETALVFVPVVFLLKARVPAGVIAVSSGLLWGAIHAFAGKSSSGWLIAWPFCCFTMIILDLDGKSRNKAWLVASTVHGLCNLVLLTLIWLILHIRAG